MRSDLNSSAISDPDLMRLPHPKRMEIAGMLPMWEELFAADLEPLKAALLDLDQPLEFVIKGMLMTSMCVCGRPISATRRRANFCACPTP